ncbi:putative baseplate assembly protein [Streptomyces triticiradicis]|uniref:Putative baseplate assembly protein n=1 Tax=Streptomyces triticiradicis TaxID=2651189 RepID=A0A7J5DMS7_9ACTN|nr:putative baseplate assembly protein [Streptomyces triticiradicis]KAB1990052.1 putative baseplate assembly protein [Streptomyces triticiradicis]
MTGTCHCGCGGEESATGAVGPSGADAPALRSGTHADFLSAMLARLSGPAYPALGGLTARTPDDPAVALLDAWAVLGDLLTFYSERIANEGYLRTATEEQSLALLGRLVGHRARPGVAADTYLAYTLDRDPRAGEDPTVTIARGARSQSVPGPGEQAQSFETAEDLTARWSWNELRVLRRRPYRITASGLTDRNRLTVEGTANNLKAGDQLLAVFSAEKTADRSRRTLLTVSDVRLDRDGDVTVVGLPGTALPSLEDLTDQAREWITDEEGGPGSPWPAGSRIVVDFDDQVLTPLRADLDEPTTPTAFADRLTGTVARAREAEDLAGDHEEVADWFGRLARGLGRLIEQARALEPPQPVRDDGEGTPEPGFPALAALGALLPALRTAPVRPPLNARHLARDPAQVFAPGADLGPRLLAGLDPRLRDGLFDAWRRTDATAPPALRELRAMRVTATPFGATAPLKPVYQGNQVVRYDDWPLTGSKFIGMKIGYDETGAVPNRADFTYTEGGGSVRASYALPFDGTVDFGPGRIKLTTTEPEPDPGPGVAADPPEPGVTAELQAELPVRTLFVSRPAGIEDDRVHVAVSNGTTLDHHLSAGDRPPPADHGGLQVSVSRTAAGTDPAVEITLSARLEQTSRNVIALDAVYEGIAPGSWVAVHRPRKGATGQIPGDPGLSLVITRVTGVRVLSRADFGITGKVTELTLEDRWLDEQDVLLSHIRDTTVHARGDALTVADEPVTDDVGGNRIELAELYDGLDLGRWIVVTGERTDIPATPGVRGTELTMIAGVGQSVDPGLPGDTVRTTLTLTAALAHSYRRDTVRVLGNVVHATHGATRDEPIGSGDASRPGQTFALWQAPLTWLAADTPLGASSTLEVRVDGVLWHEVDSLAGRGPTERVYVTGTTGDGRTTVTFGDGAQGARLPTGQENVRARYRVGVGRAADVAADRVTQLTTRPLGVTAVTNPLPATGGADPDGPGAARRTIPLALTALDRLVSVPDHEDFARSRAGIGRASARQLTDGTRQIVHVTVAGVDDIPLTEDSDVVRTLHASLAAQGDPRLAVGVAVRELVLLVVVAGVKVAPDHRWDLVEPRVRRALLARLGYAGRELGQSAHLSEVLAAAQAVPGVDHVDVDAFTGVPGNITPAGLETLAGRLATPQPVVEARLARYAEEVHRVTRDGETLTDVAARHGITVAELLRLNPDITDTRPLRRGRSVFVFRGVRPAQLALLSPDVPDTLILKEVRA